MLGKEKPIDLAIDVVTPENIEFEYEICGPLRRLFAFALDWTLVSAAFLLLNIVVAILIGLLSWLGWYAGLTGILEALAGVYQAAQLVAWFIVIWFYGCVFETWWNGQTPGKRLLRLRVLSYTGKPINAVQAVFRNFFRGVDMFPLIPLGAFAHYFITIFGLAGEASFEDIAPLEEAYLIPTCLVGLIAMSTNSRFQRIGDLFCGTMVVVETRSIDVGGFIPYEDPRTPELAEYIPRTFPFTRSLRTALTAYVEKRRHLSAPRRREIARHLAEPLLERFGLPADTSYDLFLCAAYYRAFSPDRGAEPPRPLPIRIELPPLQAPSGEFLPAVGGAAIRRQSSDAQAAIAVSPIETGRDPTAPRGF